MKSVRGKRKELVASHGLGEETAIDGLDDRLSSDGATAEESAVETLDGILAARDRFELDVDVALGVGVYCNVNNLAILLLALVANVVLELSGPVVATLPAMC